MRADEMQACEYGNPSIPCVLYTSSFKPTFDVIDPFKGINETIPMPYYLRIIGGGIDSNHLRYFSESEIKQYNPGYAGDLQSMIILPASGLYQEIPVFDKTTPGVSWSCKSNTPCYDVRPIEFGKPNVFYFILQLESIRNNPPTSYCQYKTEFKIGVQGIPLSFDGELIAIFSSMAVCFLTLSIFLWFNHEQLHLTAPKFFGRKNVRFTTPAISYTAEKKRTVKLKGLDPEIEGEDVEDEDDYEESDSYGSDEVREENSDDEAEDEDDEDDESLSGDSSEGEISVNAYNMTGSLQSLNKLVQGQNK